MSLTRRPHVDRGLDRLDPQEGVQSPALAAGLSPMMLAQLAGGVGNAFAQSLLPPSLDGALSSCFGPGVAGLQLTTGEDSRYAAMDAVDGATQRLAAEGQALDPEVGRR